MEFGEGEVVATVEFDLRSHSLASAIGICQPLIEKIDATGVEVHQVDDGEFLCTFSIVAGVREKETVEQAVRRVGLPIFRKLGFAEHQLVMYADGRSVCQLLSVEKVSSGIELPEDSDRFLLHVGMGDTVGEIQYEDLVPDGPDEPLDEEEAKQIFADMASLNLVYLSAFVDVATSASEEARKMAIRFAENMGSKIPDLTVKADVETIEDHENYARVGLLIGVTGGMNPKEVAEAATAYWKVGSWSRPDNQLDNDLAASKDYVIAKWATSELGENDVMAVELHSATGWALAKKAEG